MTKTTFPTFKFDLIRIHLSMTIWQTWKKRVWNINWNSNIWGFSSKRAYCLTRFIEVYEVAQWVNSWSILCNIHFGWKKTARISSEWVKNTTRNSIWNKLDILLSSKERTYLRFSYTPDRIIKTPWRIKTPPHIKGKF